MDFGKLGRFLGRFWVVAQSPASRLVLVYWRPCVMEDWDFFDEHELQAGRVAYTSSYASAHARFSR